MKIKDYLRKVETANEVMALSNRCGDYEVEYKLYMEYDNYKTYSAKTWKEFQKLIKQEFGVKQVWYYTDSSDYQWYGGWRYELNKSNNGIYWLVLNNAEKIEV